MAQQVSTNTFGVSKWVVSADPTQGTHTTIAAALTSASSGDSIWIREGVYTENLTGKDGVTIQGMVNTAEQNTVTIIGKISYSGSGTFSLVNLNLQTNSDFILDVSGSNASNVSIELCTFTCTNHTGISFSCSNSSALLHLRYCSGDLQTTGIALYSSTSTGKLEILYSLFYNTGLSTLNSDTSAGITDLYFSQFANPVSTTGTGGGGCQFCDFISQFVNSVAYIVNGTGTNTLVDCYFTSGTAACINVNPGCTLNLIGTNTLSASGTNVIQGSGTVKYNVISCGSTASGVTASKVPLVTYVGSPFAFASTSASVMTVTSEGTGTNDAYYVANSVSGTNTFAFGKLASADRFSLAYNGDGTLSGGTEWMNFDPATTTTNFIFDATVAGKLKFNSGFIANLTTTSGAGPHTITTSQYFISVDTSAAAPTIKLPNAPATGQKYIIKDASGNANTNNITVTTVGGVVTIDGATSYTMNTNYRSISLIFNGSNYLIW